MEAHSNWNAINNTSDIMKLLQLIQTCMTQWQSKKNQFHAAYDTKYRLYSLRQGQNMSDADYPDKSKDNVSVLKQFRSNIGAHGTIHDNIARDTTVNKNIPSTSQEINTATKRAREQYLAIMFLFGNDKQQYGTMLRSLENNYIWGMDTYPPTLVAVYEYLVNYKQEHNQTKTEKTGLAFYNRQEDGPGEGQKWQNGENKQRTVTITR